MPPTARRRSLRSIGTWTYSTYRKSGRRRQATAARVTHRGEFEPESHRRRLIAPALVVILAAGVALRVLGPDPSCRRVTQLAQTAQSSPRGRASPAVTAGATPLAALAGRAPSVSALPRPEPLFLPPPVSAFTVAQARRSASPCCAAFFVAFLDVFGLAFLLVRIRRFVTTWHGDSLGKRGEAIATMCVPARAANSLCRWPAVCSRARRGARRRLRDRMRSIACHPDTVTLGTVRDTRANTEADMIMTATNQTQAGQQIEPGQQAGQFQRSEATGAMRSRQKSTSA